MTVPRYETCTIWEPGAIDPFTGLESAGTARVYTCEARKGGKTQYSDATGSEFYPKSTFWVRSNEITSGGHAEPKEDWQIARGDHSAVTDPSTVGAEIIRGVMVHSNAKFGEPDSYTIGTA